MTATAPARTALIVASALIMGVAAGLIWWQLAEPGQWQMRDVGIALTEEASRGQFQVVVVFTLVGAIASLVWSVGVSLFSRGSGWPLVLMVIAGSVLASLIAWQTGALVGPPPPETVSGLSLGDTVPDELMVDSIAPFLVWPMAALVGVLLTSWGQGGDRDDYPREIDATTAPVTDTRS